MFPLSTSIAKLRKAQHMTQEDLGKLLGVSPQSVSKWEHETTMPDITLLPEIADIFHVSIDELFGRKTCAEEVPCLPSERTNTAYKKVVSCLNLQNQEQSLHIALQELQNPTIHSGVMQNGNNGALYADNRIALAYKGDAGVTKELLESANVQKVLEALSDPLVCRILKHQISLENKSFTVSSLVAILQADKEAIETALQKLVNLQFTEMNEVENGDEILRVYKPFQMKMFWLMVAPILSLSDKIADFRDRWFYYSGM